MTSSHEVNDTFFTFVIYTAGHNRQQSENHFYFFYWKHSRRAILSPNLRVFSAINLWDYNSIFLLFRKNSQVTFNASNIDEIKSYFQTISFYSPLLFLFQDWWTTDGCLNSQWSAFFDGCISRNKKENIQMLLFCWRGVKISFHAQASTVKCQTSTPLKQIVLKWNHGMNVRMKMYFSVGSHVWN
jgi:hypothetical protein